MMFTVRELEAMAQSKVREFSQLKDGHMSIYRIAMLVSTRRYMKNHSAGQSSPHISEVLSCRTHVVSSIISISKYTVYCIRGFRRSYTISYSYIISESHIYIYIHMYIYIYTHILSHIHIHMGFP